MDMIKILTWVLIAFTAVSAIYTAKDMIAHKEEFKKPGKWVALAIIGCITNLLDTWGIGSFATTQAGFKFTKSCEDDVMPGTLNVGDTFPVSLEAILFFGFVDLDPVVLVTMLAAAMAGAFLGAGIVCKWDLKKVRYGLGVGLFILAIILACKTAGIGPFGISGTALTLPLWKLAIGCVVNFFLGALMMIGVGLYAPCTALCALLGLNIGAAFPIMMGSCAFLMNISVFKFVKEGKYDRKATLCLATFGCVGVWIAYKVACFLPLSTLTYVICCVMLYTSFTFIKDARKAA